MRIARKTRYSRPRPIRSPGVGLLAAVLRLFPWQHRPTATSFSSSIQSRRYPGIALRAVTALALASTDIVRQRVNSFNRSRYTEMCL